MIKFDHTNKWYMHNLASVLENETNKLLRFCDTNESPHLVQTTRTFNNQQKKKKKKESMQNCGLCWLGWPQSKIERKWKEREVKNWKMTSIPIAIDALSAVTKRFHTRTGGLWKKRTSGHHLNYCMIYIGQNTEESPGDLRRLGITHTRVKGHLLMLM